MRWVCGFVLVAALSGCNEDEDERLDVGYDGGYAAGFNTTCEIRTTLIEGDWDSEAYTRGYNAGYSDGSTACLAERQKSNE